MKDPIELKNNIKKWSKELGFDDMGISGIDIKDDEKHLQSWLDKKFHGSMNYMMKHGKKRSRAELLSARDNQGYFIENTLLLER